MKIPGQSWPSVYDASTCKVQVASFSSFSLVYKASLLCSPVWQGFTMEPRLVAKKPHQLSFSVPAHIIRVVSDYLLSLSLVGTPVNLFYIPLQSTCSDTVVSRSSEYLSRLLSVQNTWYSINAPFAVTLSLSLRTVSIALWIWTILASESSQLHTCLRTTDTRAVCSCAALPPHTPLTTRTGSYRPDRILYHKAAERRGT